MATTLTEVTDLFLNSVNDYKLDTLFANSGSMALNTFVEPWLLKSIVDFSVCDQSLDYTATSGSDDGYFTEDLTTENKIILSEFMQLYWLQKNFQDIRMMRNFLSDHDFKAYSPSALLDSQNKLYNAKREELSQRLQDYAYKRNNWSNWQLQIFGS